MTTGSDGEIAMWDEGDLFVVLEPIGFDEHSAFIRVMEENGVRLGIYSAREAAKAELLKQLHERGVGSILSAVRLQEDVIPKGSQPDAYSATVAAMVARLAPKESIRLHDPYLLKPAVAGLEKHAELIVAALEPALSSVGTIAFYYEHTVESAEEALVSALTRAGYEGEVSFRRVRDIHDRMLIVDDQRGLLMGSSFNSVGKRYFLLDYLRDQDAATLGSLLAAKSIP